MDCSIDINEPNLGTAEVVKYVRCRLMLFKITTLLFKLICKNILGSAFLKKKWYLIDSTRINT